MDYRCIVEQAPGSGLTGAFDERRFYTNTRPRFLSETHPIVVLFGDDRDCCIDEIIERLPNGGKMVFDSGFLHAALEGHGGLERVVIDEHEAGGSIVKDMICYFLEHPTGKLSISHSWHDE